MIVTVKEITDKYGFKKLVYKYGRKKLAEITYPNEYHPNIYRADYTGCNICFDNRDFEHLKNNVENTLNGIYFGNVIFEYLNY